MTRVCGKRRASIELGKPYQARYVVQANKMTANMYKLLELVLVLDRFVFQTCTQRVSRVTRLTNPKE